MRKARYDMRAVAVPNAQMIGFSTTIARPGNWVQFDLNGHPQLGRVLGRIAESDTDGADCKGYLAVIRLICEGTAAGVFWVRPDEVQVCYAKPPANLLAWLTGPDWVTSKDDIAKIVAMSTYGTLCERFIASRNDPDKAYNARPEYVQQFILKD